MRIITIDFGPDKEPERIDNVTSIEFSAGGIFVFHQTLRYGVQTRYFDYNSYVTMTIH